mmetsp:Transcript_16378/g.44447  ORF Transcript_16378/g.44447 Transcript_16378/m.44447 type:complete len:441 (-) Transcript_16378:42-1364(-)
MAVLALRQLAHPDDCINVLAPAVHGQVDDLGQAGGHGAQRQGPLPWVNELLLGGPVEAHVHEALDEELGGHLLQDLLAIPGHLSFHWFDDERVAAQERPAHSQSEEGRLACGPARRTIAALDPDPLGLHQPVVTTGVHTQQGHALLLLRQTTVEGAHVGVAPEHARANLRGGELDAGLQTEVGAAAAALCKEEAQLGGRPFLEVQVVKVHTALDGIVNTAQVNVEFTVDEDPHVVVAAEVERLAAAVDEGAAELQGEVEVVRIAVERDGRILPALPVNREEARVFIHIGALRRAGQRKLHRQPDVDARNVPVPLVEVLLGRKHWPSAEDGPPIRTQAGFNKTRDVAVEGLKVRVVSLEVPDDCFEEDLVQHFWVEGSMLDGCLTALQQQVVLGDRASCGARSAACGAERLALDVTVSKGAGSKYQHNQLQCRSHCCRSAG